MYGMGINFGALNGAINQAFTVPTSDFGAYNTSTAEAFAAFTGAFLGLDPGPSWGDGFGNFFGGEAGTPDLTAFGLNGPTGQFGLGYTGIDPINGFGGVPPSGFFQVPQATNPYFNASYSGFMGAFF